MDARIVNWIRHHRTKIVSIGFFFLYPQIVVLVIFIYRLPKRAANDTKSKIIYRLMIIFLLHMKTKNTYKSAVNIRNFLCLALFLLAKGKKSIHKITVFTICTQQCNNRSNLLGFIHIPHSFFGHSNHRYYRFSAAANKKMDIKNCHFQHKKSKMCNQKQRR